jgi:hypothetical protein
LVGGLLLAAPGLSEAKGKAKPLRHVDTTPNPEDTDVLSFQLEENFYSITENYQTVQTHYVNATLDYSLSNGVDLQLATYNCPLAGGAAQNYQCDTYLNLSYTYKFNPQFSLTTGSQNGTVMQSSVMQWHASNYSSLSYQPFAWLSLRAGPYWVNQALSTTTDYLGYTTGFNLTFGKDVMMQADYFSGSNNVSGATVNLFYKIFYLGVGVPEQNSGNEFFGIWGVRMPVVNL